jgi:hypothetical protein
MRYTETAFMRFMQASRILSHPTVENRKGAKLLHTDLLASLRLCGQHFGVLPFDVDHHIPHL